MFRGILEIVSFQVDIRYSFIDWWYRNMYS